MPTGGRRDKTRVDEAGKGWSLLVKTKDKHGPCSGKGGGEPAKVTPDLGGDSHGTEREKKGRITK